MPKSTKSDFSLHQAQQIWSMLDDMALNDQNGYKKFIHDQIRQGKEMLPQPKLCLQTTLSKPQKSRLYINIFEWSRVPKPKSDDDPIPVVGGKALWGKHKNDETIFCVAFNEEVCKLLEGESTDKTMLINLAIDYLNDYHSTSISRSYTIWEKEKHHGSIKMLRRTFNCKSFPDENDLKNVSNKDMNNLSISDIVSRINNENDNFINGNQSDDTHATICKNLVYNEKNQKALIQEVLPLPKYKERKIYDKHCVVLYEYSIELPEVTSVSQCELDIATDSIQLKAVGYSHLAIPLPDDADTTLAKAKFIKSGSRLEISVPTKSST